MLKTSKKQKEKKGRPLKIICDWDETIQPLKPAMIYEKMNLDAGVAFAEFFESFWENSDFSRPTESWREREIRSY